MSEEYKPYGKLWSKKMKKYYNKDELIEMLKSALLRLKLLQDKTGATK